MKYDENSIKALTFWLGMVKRLLGAASDFVVFKYFSQVNSAILFGGV